MSETAKKTKRKGARQVEKSAAHSSPKRKRKAERAFPYVRILIGEMVLGPGKVDLLEAIGRTGSISAAGRELGMSYRRAWLLVDALNHMFQVCSSPPRQADRAGAAPSSPTMDGASRPPTGASRRGRATAMREEMAAFDVRVEDN